MYWGSVVFVIFCQCWHQTSARVTIDTEAISKAYHDVRDDDASISWAFLTYEGKKIVLADTGEDYAQLQGHFTDDIRGYAYVGITIPGHEMGHGKMFAFITWIGAAVSPLKKARVSTDKAFVKAIMPVFAIEVLADDIDETNMDRLLRMLGD